MKFKVITTDGMSDHIELSTVTAKDQEEAYEILEQNKCSSLDFDLLLTMKQFKKLKEMIK